MVKTFQVYFLSIISLFFWLPLAVLVMLYAVIARWLPSKSDSKISQPSPQIPITILLLFLNPLLQEPDDEREGDEARRLDSLGALRWRQSWSSNEDEMQDDEESN